LESLLNVKSYLMMNKEWQEERQNEQRFDEVLERCAASRPESLLAAHGCARGEEHASELDRDLHEIFVRLSR
jgi:hypothetical protein